METRGGRKLLPAGAFVGDLRAVCVHMIVALEDKIGYGDDLIALVLKPLDHGGKGIRGAARTVVAEDDRPVF